MDYLKGFNVIVLSLLLMLTGCFGMFSDDDDDSAEAEDSTVTATLTAQDIADAMILASNSPPEITVKKYVMNEDALEDLGDTENNWDYAGYYVCPDDEDDWSDLPTTLEGQRASAAENGSSTYIPVLIEQDDCLLQFAFASVDPDGDSMTKGLDVDLDGVIDIVIEPNNGVVLTPIDNSTAYGMPFMWWSENEAMIMNIALIAIDEHGASTADILHFIDPSSINEDEDDFGSPSFYIFSGTNGPGSDGAVIITMDSGPGLDWSSIAITASVDGGASSTVPECASDSSGYTASEDCWQSSNGPTAAGDQWNVGSDVTVDTSCTGTCTVTINILNVIEGTTLGIATIYTE